MKRLILLTMVIVSVLCSSLAMAAVYDVTNLGTLGGNESVGYGINNLGQVVGYSRYDPNSVYYHAFLYSDGIMTDLGTFGGPYSLASDINDSGQIVGYAYSNSSTFYPFLYENVTKTQLSAPGVGAGINSQGHIVGNVGTPTLAFLYKDGNLTYIGTLGGLESRARGINNSGQIVGESNVPGGGPRKAFLYSNGVMINLGTLSGHTHSYGRAINDLGVVVGESDIPNGSGLAFIYKDGIMSALGTLGGTKNYAYSINNLNQAVGYSNTPGGVSHACLYYEDGTIFDLNDLIPPNSGWELQFASDINDAGQIVGYGVINGNTRGFLLTPAVNQNPTLENIINMPTDPIILGSSISPSASFFDPDSDNHDAIWNWGDGNVTNLVGITSPVTTSHTYNAPGVYTVSLEIIDDDGGSSGVVIYQYVVVYDPDGGFVTGGGWIISPEGAYVANPSLTGKANFGFVSKYKKGANTPTGNTQFNFRVADLNFHSSSYDWLVIAGAKAMFKGLGTINGVGNYGFMLSAIDGDLRNDVDKFRIKIWDKSNGDLVIYDNQLNAGEDAEPTTAIGGGNIVIHKDSKAPEKLIPNDTCLLNAYPNPFNPEVWLPYRLSSDTKVAIYVHDISGRLIRSLELGYQSAGYYVSKSKAAYWDGKNEAGEQVASGIYFYTIKAGDFSATKKMIVKK